MSFPVGVTTAEITSGTAFDVVGDDGTVTITVKPLFGGTATHLVWEATGAIFTDWPRTVTATSPTSSATVEVPHVDQDGFIDGSGNAVTMWRYGVTVTVKSAHGSKSWEKIVQPLVGQATVDVDLVQDGTSADPVVIPPDELAEVQATLDSVVADLESKVDVAGRRGLAPTPATITATLSDSGFRNVCWMRTQRDVIFAMSSNVLRQSTDNGATWNDINTFTTGYSVHGVRDLDNGELLVSLLHVAGTSPGEVWKSSGYNPANLAAESWTKVLTASGTTQGNYIEGAWGMSVFRNIVIVSEYGANKTPPNNARFAYKSTDYGATFTQIFDLGASFNGHIHGCCYDPYDERIWITWGDYLQSDATTGRGIAYSDDMGTTWRTITTALQPTGIHALPNCVLFVSDTNPNGIYRVPRTADKNAIPVVETAYLVDEASTLTWLGSQIFHARYPGAPVLLPFINSGGTARAGLIIATVDGYNFTEIWRDSITYSTTSSGPVRVVGPTSTGKLVATVKDGRQSANSRLIADAPTWG